MTAALKNATDLHGYTAIALTETVYDGETFFKISSVHEIRPFFMSIVSDSDHWMFVSSNGGISAGRKNPEYALFPYYTDDKITESAELTGSKTIIRVNHGGSIHVWEPFSARSEGQYKYTRNLYKNRWGNRIIFEEINETLSLTFRYEWASSNLYGFVKKARIINNSGHAVHLQIADGIQNILPYGVGAELQTKVSNLADAYKRSERVPDTGLGIFSLSAIIVDKAEPSEALKANVAWYLGMEKPLCLLSSLQLNQFRIHGTVSTEDDVKGEKGAYFVVSEQQLTAAEEKEWLIVANVNLNHAAVIQLCDSIDRDKDLYGKVLADIQRGTDQLIKLVAASDGLQSGADNLKNTRHYANTLFNIMRGGIFDNNYQIEKRDFCTYLQHANRFVFDAAQPFLAQLPDEFSLFKLQHITEASGDPHLQRLAAEYLPLKFSRRHGDPSRPWNQFSINTRNEGDGSKVLDYQGNWRDIFQNWEALVHAYPCFIEGMIFKFLNASTFDGYNPYRVMKGGFDWETIEPDNPWSYIGYWGDHQIIYLLKFLEYLQQFRPGRLHALLNKQSFVYAHVPYRIKTYEEIVRNPKDTILFDHTADRQIRERMKLTGADGALLTDSNGHIYQVGFTEKILATVLSKLSNLVPEGGIWMNTQRPEWNDANNALVGNGLSMVTLCYLRRFLAFFQPVFEQEAAGDFDVSAEMHSFFDAVSGILGKYRERLGVPLTDGLRKEMTDALGSAGSSFRTGIYNHRFSGKKEKISAAQLAACFRNALAFLEQAIGLNRREDGLYHTYNLIDYQENGVAVARLAEMLEGQVAALSSGFLSNEESLHLLDALKNSALYRKDQYSYILYPNKNLPGFLQKNTVPDKAVAGSALLKQLLEEGNRCIIERDIRGAVHFNGNFRNAGDLDSALDKLDTRYQPLVASEREQVLQVFEAVFNHKEFTGRSGTFFGYEGLGSIYWHMVSKLLLAVQETCLRAFESQADEATLKRLAAHYYAINEGIGVHKPPQLYGAFPTDPYSHTPMHRGAQQPGMTGQVKEDILCRFGELGLTLKDGRFCFNPRLLKRNEFTDEDKTVEYVNVYGEVEKLQVSKDSVFFTCCQVPVLYTLHGSEGIETVMAGGTVVRENSTFLSQEFSTAVFERKGTVKMIRVFLKAERFIIDE